MSQGGMQPAYVGTQSSLCCTVRGHRRQQQAEATLSISRPGSLCSSQSRERRFSIDSRCRGCLKRCTSGASAASGDEQLVDS